MPHVCSSDWRPVRAQDELDTLEAELEQAANYQNAAKAIRLNGKKAIMQEERAKHERGIRELQESMAVMQAKDDSLQEGIDRLEVSMRERVRFPTCVRFHMCSWS